MEPEIALVIVTSALAVITAYYALNTRKMLKEQRRAVEYQIKPVIRIKHPIYPTREIGFVASENDAFNLNATVIINGISDKQELGPVLIGPNRPGDSRKFDLDTLLGKVGEKSSATLTIRIEYQSFSGYKYCEEFDYYCSITESGIQKIVPHEKYPINRRLIKEGC